MRSTQKDIALVFKIKDGQREIQIEGASNDLMAAASFMACRVCALMGKTPEAAEAARQLLVDSLNTVGPGAVRGMFEAERRKAPSTHPKHTSTPPRNPQPKAPMTEDSPCFTAPECRDLGCQCERCKNNTFSCCFVHPIHCPNSDSYNPDYVCPGFTPKKEAHSNAAE